MVANVFNELELDLHDGDGDTWLAEARAVSPDPHAPGRGIGGPDAVEIPLDLDELLDVDDDEQYALLLTKRLFGEAGALNDLGAFVEEERAIAARDRRSVRMRLVVGPRAQRLHAVRWELLRDPVDREASMMLSDRLVFSRYLDSRDGRAASLRSWGTLEALVAVAAWPSDETIETRGAHRGEVVKRRFDAADVGAEIATACAVLEGASTTIVGVAGNATPDAVFSVLHRGIDVFYLACHGFVQPKRWVESEVALRVARDPDAGDARIVLQDVAGKPNVIKARDFANRLRELATLPRLAVLVSCQSAGNGTSHDLGALATLGPLLSRAGIPAVVAMQGDVTQQTAAQFVTTLFRELRTEFAIDRAFAAARRAVRHRPDWWVPVLFTRLRSNRIAYRAGFQNGAIGTWMSLLRNLRRGNVTPIIGPRLSTPYVGSHRDLARRWASTFQFPLEPPFDRDLPQVAQYLAKYRGPRFPRDELRSFVGLELLARFSSVLRDDLPAPLAELPSLPDGTETDDPLERTYEKRRDDLEATIAVPGNEDVLDALMSLVRRARRDEQLAKEAHESYDVLAQLRAPVYLTTQPWSTLTDAVSERLVERPTVDYFRWKAGLSWPLEMLNPAELRGTRDEPLVYHLFGHVGIRNSVVLTEDDYFEYLLQAGSELRQKVPIQVKRRILDSSLLLVGFGLDEWPSRVLFNFIRSLPESPGEEGYHHVAVQVDPEESDTRNAERLREYLGKQLDSRFEIYWGSAEEFLAELGERLQRG